MFPLTWNQPHPRCFRCRLGCCPSGIWCSRGDAVLPSFCPCRGWHLVADLRRRFQWCRRNALVVGGGSASERSERAEWWAPPNETRGKEGRRGRLCRCKSPCLRRPHHSATRDSSERNLIFNPVCGAPFRETRSVERNLLRGDVVCHGFCTNLPIFCEIFTRFWIENFQLACNYLYFSEKISYQQVNNSRQSVLSLRCRSSLIH